MDINIWKKLWCAKRCNKNTPTIIYKIKTDSHSYLNEADLNSAWNSQSFNVVKVEWRVKQIENLNTLCGKLSQKCLKMFLKLPLMKWNNMQIPSHLADTVYFYLCTC